MKLVVQRVNSASVIIENEIFSQISKGYLVLLGIEKDDTDDMIEKLSGKLLKLRIFEDVNEKMNLSIKDVNGEILIVSQFTLAANCKKGTRPSFDNAKEPDTANKMYEKFVNILNKSGLCVKTGKFGAMMDVNLQNDGPITFILEA